MNAPYETSAEQQKNQKIASEVLIDALSASSDVTAIASLVSTELFEIADLLRQESSLLRALTDPGRKSEDRQALIDQLLSEKCSPDTLAVCGSLVGQHWTNSRNLVRAIEKMGVVSLLQGANASGQLNQIESELFAVSQLLSDQRDLRIQLSELGEGTPDQRASLLQNLVGGKVLPATSALLYRAVKLSAHGRLLQKLREYRQQAAATYGATLVTVASATDFTSEQRSRLQKLIERQVGGPVTLAVAIDPRLIGGFRINYGQEAADSSIRSELAQAKRAMAR